jgi:UDP-N-acetylmuramoyl-tripeptide--D-alanyl-D-alanine ligase
VYIIGSMLELGASSAGAHAVIGRRLASSKADMLFFYGPETVSAAEVLAGAGEGGRKIPFFHTDIMNELSQVLADFIRSGDLVLLKGSRGCALEQLTDVLTVFDEGKAALHLAKEGVL